MSEAIEWLYARDVAADLDLTVRQAQRWLKRIPGAELLYQFEGARGERWRITRAAYDAWRASPKKAKS